MSVDEIPEEPVVFRPTFTQSREDGRVKVVFEDLGIEADGATEEEALVAFTERLGSPEGRTALGRALGLSEKDSARYNA